MKIIEKLKGIADTNGWKFIGGYEASLNLFDEALSSDDIVMMVDLNVAETITFSGMFSEEFDRRAVVNVLIAKKSNLDEVVGNENSFDFGEGKWEKRLRPLYDVLDDFIFDLKKGCDGVRLVSVNKNAVINYLDVNLDGWLLRLEFKSEENV